MIAVKMRFWVGKNKENIIGERCIHFEYFSGIMLNC